MRYTIIYIYGRYQISDMFTDHVVCFSYTSEDANSVCHAMNKLESDTHENENDIGILV